MADITNQYGYVMDFEAAVNLMDDDLVEMLGNQDWDSEQDYFAAYCAAHRAKHGEAFVLDDPNPVW